MKEKSEIQQRLADSREAALPPVLERVIITGFLGRVFPGQKVHRPKMHWLDGGDEARTLMFPPGADEYEVPGVLTSYRGDNLNLHNPVSDVRTVGPKVFHVVEYGHKVPAGKVPVPQQVFFNLLQRALQPDPRINVIPYTTGGEDPAVEMMMSAYLRPLANLDTEVYKKMTHAVYLSAPGSMVANAHFVQEVFGNPGNPWTEDPLNHWQQWSRGASWIIVNPFLNRVTKAEAGLPHFDDASEQLRKTGMCWHDEGELYNGGEPFHLTLGDDITPTAVTLIADPYFGYNKKTTKHHMRRFTHLIGRAIEEHSGGAYGYVRGSKKRPTKVNGLGASGSGKSEKGKEPISKIEGGKIYSRLGTHWGERQPGAEVVELRQILDDITITGLSKDGLMMCQNTERKWFQRPDGTIVAGEDGWTERYFAMVKGGFASNFTPLTRPMVQNILEKDDGDFHQFEPMMQEHLHWAPHNGAKYTVCSAVWREVEKSGKKVRTTNPRFLEDPTLRDHNLIPLEVLEAHGIDLGQPAIVDVSVQGLRCNAPDHTNNVTPLCALGALHYWDPITVLRHMIVPVTGKSQSTDGNKGNEDACTCGPFDSMPRMFAVEEAFVTMALARTRDGRPLSTFVVPAAYVGPRHKIDQDWVLHATSLFSILDAGDYDPEYLIREGLFEKLEDFDFLGERIPAHILGYRLTEKGRKILLGKMWVNPEEVVPDDMLRPELQDLRAYAQSHQVMEKTQRDAVTEAYFGESEFEYANACPEIQIVLSLMKDGHWNGKTANDREIQEIFHPEKLRDRVLSSSWYRERLVAQQRRDVERLEFFARELQGSNEVGAILAELERVKSKGYLESLHGTLGANRIG